MNLQIHLLRPGKAPYSSSTCPQFSNFIAVLSQQICSITFPCLALGDMICKKEQGGVVQLLQVGLVSFVLVSFVAFLGVEFLEFFRIR